MASLDDILSALKNGVVAINNLNQTMSLAFPGGIGADGITTGIPPGPGKIGEFVTRSVSIGTGVAAVSGSAGQIFNNISLSAGIWIVGGTAGLIKTGGTVPTYTHMHANHGNGITAIQTSPFFGTVALHITSNNENGWIFPFGITPYYLSTAATINAVGTCDFAGGTAEWYGVLWGLRVA